jgi:putative tryptophan/tyrosine transport system substrate-binding protein
MRLYTIWLIATLALVILTAPLAPEAQPPTRVHRIGVLVGTTPGQGPGAAFVEAFLEEMRALGYLEGQHLVLEYRGAEGQYERFPALAAELVRLPVDVLLVPNTPGALAAKHATTTIPIVMVGLGDPVGSGLVASLARPGGNITGMSVLHPDLVGKQLEILKDVRPTLSRVAVLWNPANPVAALSVRAAEMAAQALGVQLHLVEARGPEAFDSAFAAMTRAHEPPADHMPGPVSGVCGGWQPPLLWAEPAGHVAARGHVCGQDPEGGQACRPAGGAAHEVRVRH